VLFVWKDREGNIKSIELTQLGEKEKMRLVCRRGTSWVWSRRRRRKEKIAEAGILEASEESYGITEEDILDIAEAIPKGSAAGILISNNFGQRA
jgi:hypothetical protein